MSYWHTEIRTYSGKDGIVMWLIVAELWKWAVNERRNEVRDGRWTVGDDNCLLSICSIGAPRHWPTHARTYQIFSTFPRVLWYVSRSGPLASCSLMDVWLSAWICVLTRHTCVTGVTCTSMLLCKCVCASICMCVSVGVGVCACVFTQIKVAVPYVAHYNKDMKISWAKLCVPYYCFHQSHEFDLY